MPLPELLAELRERHDRIRSLRVVCRAELKGQPTLPIEIVFAASGHLRMDSVWHCAAGRPEKDAYAIARYYDGHHDGVYEYLNRRWEITARFAIDRYLDKVRENSIVEALGWWPPGDPTPPPHPADDLIYLVDLVAHPAIHEVQDAAAQIEDVPCRVLEIPRQVHMWVDVETLDIRRREYLANADREPAEVVVRYLLRDYREVTTGVRLPFKIVTIAPGNDYHSEATVLSYEVNSIGSEVFVFAPRAGTLVYYRDEDLYEQIPGGIEAFNDIIAAAREMIPKPQMENGDNVPSWLFLACTGGLTAMVVVAEIYRLRRDRAVRAGSLRRYK